MAQLRRTAATCLLAFLFIQCGRNSNPPETPASPSDTTAPPPAEPPSAMDGGTSNIPATPATIAAQAQQNQQTTPSATAAADQTKTKLSDQQIAKVTDAANSAEIAQANVAIEKSKNPEVVKFAKMMVKHHTEAKKEEDKLAIGEADSSVSEQLSTDASGVMSSLQRASKQDFDRSYIDAQVDEHRKVLNTIQNQLLADVTNTDLKNYLQKIQPTVEKHLKAAEDLQLALERKATANSNSKSKIGDTK